MLEMLKAIAKEFKTYLRAYRLVLKDRRTPILAKVLLGAAVGYALMPFDLIPDFIPVIGHLDDIIIVPGLVYLALKLIPKELIEECRAKERSIVKILFVCVENSCRSQMAEGFARMYGKVKIEVFSAGSRSSGKVNQTAVEVMKEIGIDIGKQGSKGFDALPYKEFDLLITMGCGDECPFVPAKKRIDWQIRDPKGQSIEVFREVRDLIKEKVLILLLQEFQLQDDIKNSTSS